MHHHVLCAVLCALFSCSLSALERPATVLLISHDDLVPAWQGFADWKTAQGKSTKILALSEIEQGYSGKDLQEKIRLAVREHIDEQQTKWVIIGGDSGGTVAVPDRDTLHTTLDYKDVPTDAYYLSATDWDANDDGVYGDWSHDQSDITWIDETASIGRIPVRTADQVKAYTQKVIAYESAYPADNFALNFVQTCPEPHAYRKLITSARQLAQSWPTLNAVPYYAHRSAWDTERAGDHELSPKGFIELINAQTQGKMHVHGHGLLKLWVLENHEKLDVNQISQLGNTNFYPLITTVSCHTGRYDDVDDPSIAEAMVRLDGAGAIAVIAPSREGVPVFKNREDMRRMMQEGLMDGTTRLMTDFWDIGLTKNVTIGEAIAEARKQQIEREEPYHGLHWLMSGVNVLGDPTLPVRNANPLTPVLDLPQTGSVGQSLTLNLNTTVPHAEVCIWKKDEIYQVGRADETGLFSATITPQTVGSMTVTIAGTMLNIVQSDIVIK